MKQYKVKYWFAKDWYLSEICSQEALEEVKEHVDSEGDLIEKTFARNNSIYFMKDVKLISWEEII